MAILRCTRKLLKELRVKDNDLVQESEAPSLLGDWYVHLLLIERRKCVLFTNAETLFTFAAVGLRRPAFDRIGDIFRNRLEESLREEGVPVDRVDTVLMEYEHLPLGRTENRRVLGSMNDLAHHLKWYMISKGSRLPGDLVSIQRWLNDMPMGAIGYSSGSQEIRKRLGLPERPPSWKGMDRERPKELLDELLSQLLPPKREAP
jgi:hypothetical protein